MDQTGWRRGADFYARRAFAPCLLLTVGLFLLRVWLDGWWVEYRVSYDIKRAAQYASVEHQHDILVDIIVRLDGYKRHMAGLSVFFPRLDTTGLDKVREDIDWYRLKTAGIYDDSQYHDDWARFVLDFLDKYELADVGVLPADQRRKCSIVLQFLAALTVITFFLKLSGHEWGEM